jgi:hypothetical protein
MIRPLVKHLETKPQAQEIIENMIHALNDDEVMMIALRVKLNRPSLFPSCLDQEALFAQVSLSVLYKSLVHYSMMLSTASRDVLNSIYLISISIMERIIDENNRNSLSKIYQSAVRSLSKCPAAIKFIQAVSRQEPAVVTMEVIDYYEWDRALESVGRGLKRLIAPDDSAMVTITDCHSWTSVTKFLHSDIKPKVLPFASEREMLEGMSRMVRQEQPTTPKSFDRRRSRAASDNPSRSDFPEGTVEELSFGGLTALVHPAKLMNSDELMKARVSKGLSFTVADFLEAVKVSSTD